MGAMVRSEERPGSQAHANEGEKGTFMFRKSALAMAMLGALTTGRVVALGLGEIELKSSLNQPLNAEVALLSATDAELQELKVEMASPEAFARAGIERPLFLSRLRFSVTRNTAGKPVVLITSREVVREPFLDFLMEISWSKGRLLREYTVLVDPPVTMPAAAPAVAAPARVAPAVQSPPGAATVRNTARNPRPYAPATGYAPAGPGEYGPTRRNDTLWRIAEQVRPDGGVSVEQTMLGLLRANPEAFVGNNINNLKEGYVLRVPSREDLVSISKAEARRESRAQYAAWLAARRGSRGATPVEAVAQGAAAEAVAGDAGPSLQLVAPEGGGAASATGSGEAGADIETLQRELIMANEALEAQRRQSEEMSSRLSMLEEQIRNMQRLIQLKDDALAQLQAQAGADTDIVEQAMEAASEGADEVVPVEEAVPASAETSVEDAGAASANPSAAGTESATEGEAPVGEDVTAGLDPLADTEADVMATAEPAQQMADTGTEPEAGASLVPEAPAGSTPEAAPAVPPAVPETATPAGFVDRLLARPLWLGAGAGVLALLALLGLRRRRSVETEFQESILQAAGSESTEAGDSEIVSAAGSVSQDKSGESSLLSEFAVSDMGSVRSDGEADPLAEADVYLAYGRYQQAEDLVAEALEKDPHNEELNLKMLEIFTAANNQPAFDTHAELILARLGGTEDPLWEKVAEMGRELCPDNPLYRPGAGEAPADAPIEPPSAEPEASDETTASESTGEAQDAASDIDAPEEAGMDETVQGAQDEDNSLEFDIDLGAFEPEDAREADEAPAADAGDDPAGIDTSATDEADQDKGQEFDIESLSAQIDELQDESAADAGGDGELDDLDEIATKLDLARAYIDMGDPDGARSILDEVMEEGSEEQKDEARGIMEQIA
ncbi:MAG TPA: hypothetical protein ENJ79_07535 [Gammaproteobacteria bacterium]|nr:hypothetical protein [Gammaproteobacteria bacterium]